jgi:hypothetical protein
MEHSEDKSGKYDWYIFIICHLIGDVILFLLVDRMILKAHSDPSEVVTGIIVTHLVPASYLAIVLFLIFKFLIYPHKSDI